MKLDIGREFFPRPRRLYDPIRVKAEGLHGVSQGIPIAASRIRSTSQSAA
jgi:hypothetical protein